MYWGVHIYIYISENRPFQVLTFKELCFPFFTKPFFTWGMLKNSNFNPLPLPILLWGWTKLSKCYSPKGQKKKEEKKGQKNAYATDWTVWHITYKPQKFITSPVKRKNVSIIGRGKHEAESMWFTSSWKVQRRLSPTSPQKHKRYISMGLNIKKSLSEQL